METDARRATVLAVIDETKEYFALTLTASEGGRIVWSAQTHWVEWANGTPGLEIREASLVRPKEMLHLWTSVGEPPLVVNDTQELYTWFRLGGNALVGKPVAMRFVPDVVVPQSSRRATPIGWRPTANLGPELRSAPSKKLRMKVLQRDGRRCRICGRRPDDHVDVELHVHHIRPHGRPHHGLTEEENLITLCHTCHGGLDPHDDESLYEYVGSDLNTVLGRQRDEYRQGVRRYRKLVGRILADA